MSQQRLAHRASSFRPACCALRYTPGSTLPIADSLPAGDALKAVVDAECQALASALAVVEGRVLPPSILLQEVSSQLQGPLRIELLPHPASAVPQPCGCPTASPTLPTASVTFCRCEPAA